MDRSNLLIVGVICWSLAMLDALLHLASGDAVVPLGMASVGIGYIAVRRAAGRLLRRMEEVPVPAEQA